MMPQLVTVRVQRPDGRPIRLWVPVLPAVLLLSPLVALAALGGVVACVIYSIDVVRAFNTARRIVCALPGTRVDIAQGRTAVLVTIR
ncbi:hypothetical protein ITP53_42845 [Nonomuraea sp. K274]|uniref:Uncharacterized protein n=1 Tax=Nonomuraea cypriaca TaxID=1187855 RepID=A0A931F5M3_9ACTN|nr:hypothetical protein [Nonomuraea cypriaca]MBF8192308.1 hypothetical protein [Nonomuraea cypriaca]